MRTISSSFACRKRAAPRTAEPIAVWARAVVADPAAHCATEDEAQLIASLLAELEASR